ncbi:hypothetical protein LY13_004935 [Prauserella aidingensis]|nr:hypothetical protein [Prauserella aidingensis]
MYAAAKAGVATLTIACAIELAELGVRVNAVAPVARSRISEAVAGDLMKSVERGFDRMDPANVAAVVAFLASPLCRFTGRIFGGAGDDVTVFDGWTVSHHLDNAEQRWTVKGLADALADVPLQQRVIEQAMKGMEPKLAPSDGVLDTLEKESM